MNLATLTYDPAGNLTQSQGPASLGRCTTTAYDSVFDQLPVATSVYLTGCPTETGNVALTSTQIWDRGLERVTQQTAPAMGGLAAPTTVFKYDSFGRVLQVFQPGDIPGMVDPNPAITGPGSSGQPGVQYNDAGLIRSVHFQTVNGGGNDTVSYVDHYRFIDGFGDTIAALDDAGSPAAFAPSTWLVSGVHHLYSNGLVGAVQRPFYYTGASPTDFANDATYSSAALTQGGATASAGAQYDGLGRLSGVSIDFNGTRTQYSNRFGVSNSAAAVSVQDSAQLDPGSPHFGGSTTRLLDGHGRLTSTNAHWPTTASGTVDATTSMTYLATGEVSTITQNNPGGTPYTRWMQYDALGRMVFNAEPNTSVNFSATPGASGVSGWTYAYNDAGEVVGTSDARGCGENLFRDRVGRVVAEDYSPCLESQPAWTQPNTATGQGTEAFYVYDNYGRLAKTFDRAQFSTYLFDGRGRPQAIERRIAPPTALSISSSSGSGSSSSGSGLTISGIVTDAQNNPLPGVVITETGSSPPQTQTYTTDPNGQYSFSGLASGSSYSVKAAYQNCSFVPETSWNFNQMTANKIGDFQASGGSCGTPTTTPIEPIGNLAISGTISAADGTGIPGISLTLAGNLRGSSPARTQTDASGFYSFAGLASGNYQLSIGSTPTGCTISPVSPPSGYPNVPAGSTQNYSASTQCETSAGAGGTPTGGASLEANYTPHIFVKTFTYNEANRVVNETAGADVAQLANGGSPQTIGITRQYFKDGGLFSVGSSYGPLVSSSVADAQGGATTLTYGDAAQTTASIGYDFNEALTGYALQRQPGGFANGAWTNYSSHPLPAPQANAQGNTVQTVLTSASVGRDEVDNPVAITDSAVASQWPQGYEPTASRSLKYWDDYRLREVSAQYAGGSAPSDLWVSPYTPADGPATYPPPAPVSTNKRPVDQTFSYDARGNLIGSTDDANDFFDRSLGKVFNGPTGTVSSAQTGPDQFSSAAQVNGTGFAGASYDSAGNLAGVHPVGNGPTSSNYEYTWDEVGNLASATRIDNGTTEVTEQFLYDATGHRVVLGRQLAATASTDYTVNVFDSLVLDRATFPDEPLDYERDAKTEQLYLIAAGVVGHVVYDETGTLPTALNGHVHVFMLLGGAGVGSASFVIDHDSGELVERVTYQPYGAVESDYRPPRWNSFREDVRYTGHWDDAEVGLIYFGARYYSPQLGRFISPDPLTIHALGADFNPYAFVGGSPMDRVDPSGLVDVEDMGTSAGDFTASGIDISGEEGAQVPPEGNPTAAAQLAQQAQALGQAPPAGPDPAAMAAAGNAAFGGPPPCVICGSGPANPLGFDPSSAAGQAAIHLGAPQGNAGGNGGASRWVQPYSGWNPFLQNTYVPTAAARLVLAKVWSGHAPNFYVRFGNPAPWDPDIIGITFGTLVTFDPAFWASAKPWIQLEKLAHETTHTVQWARLGALPFLARYLSEVFSNGNLRYGIPSELSRTDVRSLDITNPRWTLDQIADRIGWEARSVAEDLGLLPRVLTR